MRKIKIERIDKKQKILLISTIFIVSIVVTLVLLTSKAKYKNVQSMDLASGTINYTPADIDIVAIYQENDAGEYESVDTVPTSGYVLSDTSYCNVNERKDTNIKLSYENGTISINDISKRTKCTLYFDKYSAIDKIIGDTSGIQKKTSFTGISTASDTGIYSAPDDYGTSYYFRGLEGSLNNWVKFAGFYWQIIRVNGNGTVRMIYSGVANGNPSLSNKTGETTQIGTSMYNHTYNDNAYVGYMMGIPLNGTEQIQNEILNHSTTYEEAHSNIFESDAKIQIDSWYKIYIEDKNLSKYIDINSGFCSDREISKRAYEAYTGDGYGVQGSSYASIGRLMIKNVVQIPQNPILRCNDKDRDLFTINNANIGNKKLIYPVGLITSDELIYAGGFQNSTNSTFYLYTNQNYWTMSPKFYNGSTAGIYAMYSSGGMESNWSYSKIGLRPVLNLRADTQFTGDGSESNPFVVV